MKRALGQGRREALTARTVHPQRLAAIYILSFARHSQPCASPACSLLTHPLQRGSAQGPCSAKSPQPSLRGRGAKGKLRHETGAHMGESHPPDPRHILLRHILSFLGTSHTLPLATVWVPVHMLLSRLVENSSQPLLICVIPPSRHKAVKGLLNE